MSKMRYLISLAVTIVLAGSAVAGTISIDVPANVTDSAMTAGVVPAANWNNTTVQGSPIALVDSTGVDTGATMTLDSPNGNVGVTATPVAFANPGDNTIMAGHAYIAGAMTVDFAGIPYDTYDVYVYYNSGAIYNHQTFSIGAQSKLAGDAPNGDQGGPDSAYVESDYAYTAGGLDCENGNYVILSNISGPAFTINATPDAARGSDYTYVSGIQIVEVPEPSLLGLLGMGVLCLTGFIRRDRR